jgi:putative transposase
VGAFRTRRLDHQEIPYVFVDATYLHVRDNHHVTSKAVVIATGCCGPGSLDSFHDYHAASSKVAAA